MAKISITPEVPDNNCLSPSGPNPYICPFCDSTRSSIEYIFCSAFNKRIPRYKIGNIWHADPCLECINSRIKING